MRAFNAPLNIVNGTIASTTSYDKIVRDQLINALTTNQGERVMHPTWGCNILGILFDPTSALERHDAAAQIRDLLVHMVPRVLVRGVEVGVGIDEPNKVYIDVIYQASTFTPAASIQVAVDTTASPSAGVAL